MLIDGDGLPVKRRAPPAHVGVIPLGTAQTKLIPILLRPILGVIVRDGLPWVALADELCRWWGNDMRDREDPSRYPLKTRPYKQGVEYENGDRPISIAVSTHHRHLLEGAPQRHLRPLLRAPTLSEQL